MDVAVEECTLKREKPKGPARVLRNAGDVKVTQWGEVKECEVTIHVPTPYGYPAILLPKEVNDWHTLLSRRLGCSQDGFKRFKFNCNLLELLIPLVGDAQEQQEYRAPTQPEQGNQFGLSSVSTV